MKFFTGRVVLAAAICCGLTACGSDSDSTIDSFLADDGLTAAPLTTGFDGTWESNCAQELPFAGSEFQQATLVADGNTYTTTIRSFLDSDCSVASER